MRTKTLLPAGAAIALTIVAAFYFVRREESSAPPEIAVTQAWARATAPGADVGAVYITLENKGGKTDRLVGVTSPAAQSATLHRTVEENGVGTMREADGSIAPGARIEMKPGGTHIMLTGLAAPLKEGDTLAVSLDFEKAGRTNVMAKIGAMGAGGPSE